MMTPVLRFAPSPNGELHLGHALSALVGYEMAQRFGGRFLIRMEDIDTARCRPEYIAAALRDLQWLGIRWDAPVLRQSTRFPAYAEAAGRLRDLGVLYPCFATRAELEQAAARSPAPHDPDGVPLYPGLYRGYSPALAAARIAAGEPHALRIDIERAVGIAGRRGPPTPLTFVEIDDSGHRQLVEVRPARWGDAVIVRKDTPTSYHLAVVVDDAAQGITHVTRGLDLFAATDLHRLLQDLLGLPAPLYHHHRLIAGSDGRKLSKSARDTSLRALREDGAVPADIRAMLRSITGAAI